MKKRNNQARRRDRNLAGALFHFLGFETASLVFNPRPPIVTVTKASGSPVIGS
jgi:hypothetical protein